MIKTTLALFATALLATSPAFADGASCAGKSAKNKMDCAQSYAKMDLTAAQKSKLDAARAECQKEGCTKESMNKFMHSAKGILSKKQFAQLKGQCPSMQGTKS